MPHRAHWRTRGRFPMTVSRRRALQIAATLASGALAHAATGAANSPTGGTAHITVSVRRDEGAGPFDAAAFGTVGVFDADWLIAPGFTHMLDYFAASLGAFAGVRFFGALSSGTREDTTPTSGGTLWPDPATSPDFTATTAALHALTSRGLTPFVQLSFFPGAVAPTPIMPPALSAPSTSSVPSARWERWQSLVRTFLDTLAADARFGADAMRTWWFEVWNEPNIPVFWGGTFADYLDLYRATSRVVGETGYPIRLGGPALAYLPASAGEGAGAPLMRRFLTFLRDEPDVQCDFLSYHAKGTWAADGEPDLTTLVDAATETADAARALVPDRCCGLRIFNNEADEKIGFDTPYAPRMDERNPAWLAASLVTHDALTVRHRAVGLRFVTAADNANLQLVRAPFDGRRSLLTRAAADDPTDLLKIPAYGFYELLRLLGDGHGTTIAGDDILYPATDVFHLLTVAETHVAALFTVHPHDTVPARAWDVEYTLRDLPWQAVNVALLGIDRTHANSFTAAGGQLSPPWPDAATVARIRRAAELTALVPVRRNVAVQEGALIERLTFAPYTTALFWVTPMSDAVPTPPAWLSVEVTGANTLVRWEPACDPAFFRYDLARVTDGQIGPPITPELLRGALWVDTAPPSGRYMYAVRTVNASGIPSAWTLTSM